MLLGMNQLEGGQVEIFWSLSEIKLCVRVLPASSYLAG